MLRGKRVLVTGAGGFIGSHLTERLVREGATVRAFVRYNSRGDEGYLTAMPPEIRHEIEVTKGDVRAGDGVRAAVQGCDIILHLAALISIPYSYVSPREVIDTNVLGTANILQAARDDGRVEQVVLTSTSEVYGTARYVPIDETHPLQPQSPYSASKIAADALGLSYYHSFGLPVTLARPFNAYGPRQSARAVIPTIITQALTQNEVRLGALSPTRDFTYVEDTVDGFIRLAVSKTALGEAVNLGSGFEISIGDLATKILNLVGRELPIVTQEVRLRPEASEVQRLYADSRKAKRLLDWEPQVSLDEGLQRTIAWIAESLDLYHPEKYAI